MFSFAVHQRADSSTKNFTAGRSQGKVKARIKLPQRLIGWCCILQQGAGDLGVILEAELDRVVLLIMYCFLQQGAGDLGVILGAEGDRVVLLIMYCFLQQGAGDLGVILGAEVRETGWCY